MGLPTCKVVRHAFRRVSAVALVAVALVACTGVDDPTEPSEGPPQTSPPPITSTDSYVFTDAAGIEARLTIEEEGAVLTLTNDTGAELPEPGVFVLDARDGARTDWQVVDGGSVAEGETEWQVERPPAPEAKHIGLVVLLLGGEDYGAFVPPQPGDGT
ncbi:MAG: hypothetical protein WD186_07225 [Actinomycetota bacterium]